MFEILPVKDSDNILAFRASGKLTDADYGEFLPLLEEMIRNTGKISLYIELHDFEGWEAKAAWDDLRFGLHHDDDIKRIAIVADSALIHAATSFSNFFSHIEMRFFNKDHTEEAWKWLREKPQISESLEPLQTYKNILLPTDFSLHSDLAARRTLQMANEHNAKIHVLHTLENYTYYDEAYDPVLASMPLSDDFLMEQGEEHMQSFCERNGLNKADGVEIKTQWGDPKRSIILWAHERDTDLIVMGSHGRHGVDRLLGSVSNAVLHKVACDVLIVKQ